MTQQETRRNFFSPLSLPFTPEGTVSHLDAILRATDLETVWVHTCDYFRGIGFSHVIYGYSPDYRGGGMGPREDFLVLSTFGRSFTAELLDHRHYESSITFNWALRNVGIASFTMRAADSGLSHFAPPRADSLAFFDRHGMGVGLSIGFPPTRSKGRGVMSLIAPPGMSQDTVDRHIRQHGKAMFVVGAVAHRCLIAMPYAPAERRLTRRQREVLEWLAEGKSMADVATIMGVALPTVEKHLRLARETLGVETTAHALSKAAFLNQVFSLPVDTLRSGPSATQLRSGDVAAR